MATTPNKTSVQDGSGLTGDAVTNAPTSAPLTMSHTAEIFHQLGLKQKAIYFQEQYGTVRGTTGFFDYWFSKGIKDTKSFTTPEGVIIDACIVRDGGYYEGGGGDNSNGVVVIIGDNTLSGGWVEYYRSEGKDKKDHKSSDYQEIIECTYDIISKICIVKVRTESGSTKDIILNEEQENKVHKFDEALIGRLYIPQGVKARKRTQETNAKITENLGAEREIEEVPYTVEEMYDEAFALYMAEGSERKAYNLLKDKSIKDVSKHQENIVKLFDVRFPKNDSHYSSSPLESPVFLFSLIQDKEQQREARRRILEYMIGEPICNDRDSIKQFISIVQSTGSNKADYYQRYFIAHCDKIPIEPSFWSSDEDKNEELYKNLEILMQNKLENYQALYEGYLKRGGLWDTCLGWSKSSAERIEGIIKTFFTDHGIENPDFFPTEYDISKRAEHLATIVELIKDKKLSQEKGQEIVIRNLEGFKAYLEKEHKGLFDFYEVLYNNFEIPYDEQYFDEMSRLAAAMNGDNGEKKIIQPHANDKSYIRRLTDSACEKEYLSTLEKLYKENLLTHRKHLIAYASLCFKHGSMRQLQKLLTDVNFTEKEQAQIIKPIYANGKIHDNDDDFKYIPYITYEMAIDTLKRYLDPSEKKFGTYRDEYVPKAIVAHTEVLLARKDITAAYVQELLLEFYSTKNREGIYILLKAGGLKIDKTVVSIWIQDALTLGECDIAEKLAHYSGLQEIWNKTIIIERIKTGKIEYERKIPDYIKEYKLGKEFHKYALDLKIKSGNLEEVLKYAKEHKVTLTPSQCQNYREVKAKQIAEQKKKEEERIEQERLAALKRVELAKDYTKLIEEGKYKTDIDYKRDQKYIFFLNTNGLNVASHPLEYHADIAAKVGATKAEIMGGGWIGIDEATKTIRLYGSSGSYNAVPLEYRSTLFQVMSKAYPTYTISIE